jgi:lipoic acid synthetase
MKTLPSWFTKDVPSGSNYRRVVDLMDDLKLNTVCKEAKCPNVGECYSRGTATFMVLGDVCTRNCGFCAIQLGKPRQVDADEPKRLSEAVQRLGLKHVVITMVTRDDLLDGGAAHLAEVIRAVQKNCECTIEVLTSDFRGRKENVLAVLDARPEVFNHNVETVPRLHKKIRPMMAYQRSLDVLKWAKEYCPEVVLKSGLMLGLGETEKEVHEVLKDLRAIGCESVTMGQYLRPPNSHLELDHFVSPEEFDILGDYAKSIGFPLVQSGPLVRSSYRADEAIKELKYAKN